MGLVLAPAIPEPEIEQPEPPVQEAVVDAGVAGKSVTPSYQPQRPERRARNTSGIGNRLMADLMQDFGLTQAQAAGVVGSLAHESGNFSTLQETNPVVEGSRGGWGYAQWTGPRRVAMEEWAGSQGLDLSSYDANKGFLYHELQNTPEGSVLNSVRAANSPTEAAEAFTSGFLRPGVVAMGSRNRYALGYAGEDPQAFGWDESRALPQQEAPAQKPKTKVEIFADIFSAAFPEPQEGDYLITDMLGDIQLDEVDMVPDPDYGEEPMES